MIQRWKLTDITDDFNGGQGLRCKIFANDHLHLVVTGAGMVNAVLAFSDACRCYASERQKRHLINLGIAGGRRENLAVASVGQMFQIHSIHNGMTGRDFYPDMEMSFGLPESRLITVAKPVGEKEMQAFTDEPEVNLTGTRSKEGSLEERKPWVENILFDMEGAYLAEAYGKYVHEDIWESCMYFKILSDYGVEQESVTGKKVRTLLEKNMDQIQEVVNSLLKKDVNRASMTEEELKLFFNLSHNLCASETMKEDIKKMVHYDCLSHGKLRRIYEEFYRKNMLPVTNKRDGKKVWENMKKICISGECE